MKKIVSVLLSLLLLCSGIIAQPTSDNLFEPQVDQPINGWLILLLVVGIAYAMKKLYYSKARQKS